MANKNDQKSSGDETKGFKNAEQLDEPAPERKDEATLMEEARGSESRDTADRVIQSHPETDPRLAKNAADDEDDADREESTEEALTALVAKAQSRGLLIEPGEIARILDKNKR